MQVASGACQKYMLIVLRSKFNSPQTSVAFSTVSWSSRIILERSTPAGVSSLQGIAVTVSLVRRRVPVLEKWELQPARNFQYSSNSQESHAWRESSRTITRSVFGKIQKHPQASMREQKSKEHIGRKPSAQVLDMADTSSTEDVSEKDVLFLLAKTIDETAEYKRSLSAKQLKFPDGLHLSLIGEDRMENVDLTQSFNGDGFMNSIDSRLIARLLLFSPRMASTQSLLSENFKLLPIGTMCVSDIQYQGKGRGGNIWESPPGCLLVSFTLKETDGRTLPFLQYVVCLAIVKAVEELSQQRDADMTVSIKWPNDIYAAGLKIGGILCNSTFSDKKFNVVVGFGLNVDNRQPTTCLNALLEQANPAATPFSREEVLATFVRKFEDLHDRFLLSGFETLRDEYLGCWLHTGQRVVLEEDRKEGHGRTQIPLTIQGLTESGYLLAENDGGESFELHPDGNSLDFFKGLIRRKLPGFKVG